MRNQLCNLRALILVVGITVLAEAAPGRDVITDGDVASKLDAISKGIKQHDLHIHHNDDELRVDKIVGGSVPARLAHPYMVVVWEQKLNGEGKLTWARCGGTLIDKEWVLTAAHCVSPLPERNRVTVGAFRRGQPDMYEKVIEVQDAIRHDGYHEDEDIFTDDIALLKLSTPVSTDEPGVKTAKLPDDNSRNFNPRCVTAGWGRTVPGKKESKSKVLKEAHHMTLMSTPECSSHWGIPLTDNDTICAIDPSAIPCTGDSGGPLICYDKDKKEQVLAGVFVNSDFDCDVKEPSLFMRVTGYKDWITTSTHLNNL